MHALSLLMSIIVSTGPGADLLLVERDVRTATGEGWYEALDVVFRDADWFIALCDDPGSVPAPAEILLEGPFDLGDLVVVHLAPGADPRTAGLVGTTIFERGDVAIVSLPHDSPPMLGMPGARLVSPLRVVRARDGASAVPTGGTDGMIDDMVAAVSQDSIMAVIQHLEDYGTRVCIMDEYDQAAAWVDQWFGLHWIPCDQQWFTFYGDQTSNVIAEIPGAVSPDSIYIICGHLDSITWPMEETAPGADDNASGSATVIEAARVMAPYQFRYTVRFICFSAEEVGLVGSEYYAQSAFAAGDEILGVINLDMILYAPAGYDSLWIPYDSQSQALAEAVAQAMGTCVPSLDVVTEYDPSATYSDHSSFWNYGYPAVLGIEYDVDNNPFYHTTTDLLANYTGYWPFGTDCVRASVAALATLAQPLGPSGIPGCGTGARPSLSVSPNPASGSAVLAMCGVPAGAFACRIYGLDGRIVSECALVGETPLDLDLSGFPAGVYAVGWNGEGMSGASRLVVLD